MRSLFDPLYKNFTNASELDAGRVQIATMTQFTAGTTYGNTGARLAVASDMFYNNRPTITGSCGGNAALQSLVVGLAAIGLITNSTSP